MVMAKGSALVVTTQLLYRPNELKGRSTYLHFPKAVVRHLVHQAVEQGGRAGLVHSKLPLWCEVITFLQKNKKTPQKTANIRKM